MLVAMLLAHLVGDFVLQWDKLAQWKSRAFSGVIVHSLIVLGATLAFALQFEPIWWAGILFISLAHFTIDAAFFVLKPAISPLVRFLLDQSLHLAVILLALFSGGYLQWQTLTADIQAALQHSTLVCMLGYAFLTMPAWVLLKFVGASMVNGQPPEFLENSHWDKYLGILERVVAATLVLSGQFLFLPLVAVPRLLLVWPKPSQREGRRLILFETVTGIALAIVIGFGLRLL